MVAERVRLDEDQRPEQPIKRRVCVVVTQLINKRAEEEGTAFPPDCLICADTASIRNKNKMSQQRQVKRAQPDHGYNTRLTGSTSGNTEGPTIYSTRVSSFGISLHSNEIVTELPQSPSPE